MKRLATKNDLKDVFEIYMDKKIIPFLGHDPMPLNQFISIYEALLDDRCFYIYEVSKKVAGFYASSRHPGRSNHVAYIGTLAVAPKFHGQGVGRKMMLSEIQHLQDAGVQRIEVIVESDNKKAITFYQMLGFEIEGKLKKFYKRSHEKQYIDDYIMGLVF